MSSQNSRGFGFPRIAPTTPSLALYLKDSEGYQRWAIASTNTAGALRWSISMAVAWTRYSRRNCRQLGAFFHSTNCGKATKLALSSGFLLRDDVHDLPAGW